ncbi:S9 family peptidase [Cellvibrio sp. pealriver]|uniref:S9 family peptidase n=1 Tax=Cellvibrio sp. pealriver TaxID=1622269 RepID=UPI00066FE858|nr:S9 family peptidase [Cellvibrio sp. pealriver]
MNTNQYGHWPSPITPELLTAQGIRISDPQAVGNRLYWLETRPQEKGRNALVCESEGTRMDIFAAPLSVRTRAQEYGGASYLATETDIFYVQDSDQRLYQYDINTKQSRPITPEGAFRYADFCLDHKRQKLLAVREDYTESSHHPRAEIVAIHLQSLAINTIAQGADFYSNPRVSPDGNTLSYLRWFHPQMPWDGTECVLAQLDAQGSIVQEHIIAGSKTESIFQPQWSPTGELFFVSDRTDWWNIYRWNGTSAESIYSLTAEFATPQWVFGMSTYGFLNSDEIFCCYNQMGCWHLAIINILTKEFTKIDSEFRDIAAIHCCDNKAYFLASSATQGSQLYCYNSNTISAISKNETAIAAEYIAHAQAIEFPTRDNETAQAFFYAPTNPQVTVDHTLPPPLLVICHGGPTGATETGLNLKIQFWTSRGFAVLDVNYRGSTGYGRQYRDRLKRNWGITDIIDVCSGVDYLIAQKKIDKNKVAIRGSSAGGYTVLAALTFSDTFKAGASLYGIGDLEALAKDTHKFEAHYLDSLVGIYPQEQPVYRERSPIHHIEKLNCPVIFLQGLQDKVVPPSQAEAMVNALQSKGIYTEYITFPEEAHGFRQAQTIQQALAAELTFYLNVFDQTISGEK